MEITKCRRSHRVFGIIRLTLQACTLVGVGLIVHELERANRRLKKIEKREKHHLL